MKAGFIIKSLVNDWDLFIAVCNYGATNKVSNYGFETEQEAKANRDESDVGLWRIKRKETIK